MLPLTLYVALKNSKHEIYFFRRKDCPTIDCDVTFEMPHIIVKLSKNATAYYEFDHVDCRSVTSAATLLAGYCAIHPTGEPREFFEDSTNVCVDYLLIGRANKSSDLNILIDFYVSRSNWERIRLRDIPDQFLVIVDPLFRQ